MGVTRSAAIAILSTGLGLLAAACDSDGDLVGEAVEFRPGGSGIRYDTAFLGTYTWTEVALTGSPWPKVTAELLDCDIIVVIDGRLRCIDLEDKVHGGKKLLGSTWTLEIEGEPVDLVLADMAWSDALGRPRYTFVDSEGAPVCDENPRRPGDFGALVAADVVVDRATGEVHSKPDILRISCVGAAVGGAGDAFGWLPDELGPDAFQAALRATRLDRCGDGESLTTAEDFAAIHVRDSFGVNDFSAEAPAVSEGVYGPKGMICSGGRTRGGDKVTAPIECPDGHTIPLCSEAELAAAFGAGGPAVWVKPLAQ